MAGTIVSVAALPDELAVVAAVIGVEAAPELAPVAPLVDASVVGAVVVSAGGGGVDDAVEAEPVVPDEVLAAEPVALVKASGAEAAGDVRVAAVDPAAALIPSVLIVVNTVDTCVVAIAAGTLDAVAAIICA